MNADVVRERAKALLREAEEKGHVEKLQALYNGTLTVLRALYGPQSVQESEIKAAWIENGSHKGRAISDRRAALKGVLQSVVSEIDAGFVGNLRATLEGEVLGDFLALARAALDENAGPPENVAAVLTAAAFEDTLRRLAGLNAIPEAGRNLSDVLSDLQRASVITGAQVSIAQSGLPFRNRALHGQWSQIQRSGTESIFAFTQQLLQTHFS